VEVILDDDRAFESGRQVQIATQATERQAEIEYFRRQHGRAVLKLRGIDSMTEAEKLRGAELRIPATEVAPLEEGQFYTFDLKGCSVFAAGGEYLGIVTDVLDSGGTDILKVDLDQKEILIPFAESYLKNVDLDNKRIDVDLPEGLRDING
jgi:16S rRNA processing protein RimM